MHKGRRRGPFLRARARARETYSCVDKFCAVAKPPCLLGRSIGSPIDQSIDREIFNGLASAVIQPKNEIDTDQRRRSEIPIEDRQMGQMLSALRSFDRLITVPKHEKL